ncbi:uncharacterized protein LOC126836394 isoform X2 [Adelges cooleyi]|uniref:uncharacterized protein LOC126836394 isoform X2 n=1 Tax=Adelges cooleyi TaxID=133065 RepID=UPI00217FC7C6|nr:uncharacterized protein LOC126836394 isoform X2 [Adelges cooleyi]
MFTNTESLSSTLPRVKTKEYDDDDVVNSITCSKSLDCQNNRKSWPLSQVVECVTFGAVSHISPPKNEMETDIVDGMPLSRHNGCVTVFQDDLQLNCNGKTYFESPTNNVLKIVLPLVSENVPLEQDECDRMLYEDCDQSNIHVQYYPTYCGDSSVNVITNVSTCSSRKPSLLDEAELNRFSSTFEDIKTLLKEGLVDGLDEMPPDFQPPNPPKLYRVSSLPNILSHDSTKNQHSYLTMCATKHELLMNKLTKNSVTKQDMSVQVSTELFKNDNNVKKTLRDMSCQTEDIFVNIEVNTNLSTKDIVNKDILPEGIEGNNVITPEREVDNVLLLPKEIEQTKILLKEVEHNLLLKEIEENNKLLKEVEETNILLYAKGKGKVIDKQVEKNCMSQKKAEDLDILQKKIEQIVLHGSEQIINTSLKKVQENHTVPNKTEDAVCYTNLNTFNKDIELKTIDEDCANYANANILEEFVNEQLSLNNIDGDFDSFLFGPLPPSPVEEIVPTLPKLKSAESIKEIEATQVPFAFNLYKNEPNNSIIKSRSIDAEFSQNFQQHQKIGTRSVQSERRTYPSELPVTDEYPRPLQYRSGVHPSTIEKLSDISNSLPDTPLMGRCDFPRQYSGTSTKTMSQMTNSLSINMRGAGHGSSIGLGQAMAGAELLHLNGPGRGWYPRQRQFRPVSVEQLDKLAACQSPVGHSQWAAGDRHKPVTLPPNLSPKFFNRSPREALRRVTSLLIRRGEISEECETSQSKRGFFKSLWRK